MKSCMEMISQYFHNFLRNFRRRKNHNLSVYLFVILWCSIIIFCARKNCWFQNSGVFSSHVRKFNKFNLNSKDIGGVDLIGSRIHNRNLQNLNPRELFNLPKEKQNLNKKDGKTGSGFKVGNYVIKKSVFKDETDLKDLKAENYQSFNTLKISDGVQSKKLPQAIIIGVKKCGTRALLEFLRVHPDVRATGPEPHFFDKHYEKGLPWYRDKMPATEARQITIEKTPSYFVTKDVSRRIFNMSRHVKLIVVVRDPVTRAISDYAQVTSKRNYVKTFEAMAFLDNTTGIIDTSWTVLKIGFYARHLQKWLKYFNLEQFHFVNGENLISNPGEELEKVQKFLGLRTVITNKHFYFNSSRGFPCIKKNVRSRKAHCLNGTKGRKHPYVSPIAIKRLRDYYRPFNSKFYQLVGINFNWP